MPRGWPRELEAAGAFLDRQTGVYQAEKKPQPEKLALVDLCQALFSMNEFVYID